MSYTAPDVRLLPNRTYATLQLGGNLSLLLDSHVSYGLPGLLNLQESHWGSRGPPAHSKAPHVLYEEGPRGWMLAAGWPAAAAEVVATLRPLVKEGAISGVMLGDELVCSGLPLSNLSALATVLHDGLPGAFLYTNECFATGITPCQTAADCVNSTAWGAGHSGAGPPTCDQGTCAAAVWPEIPSALDHISLDTYETGDCEYSRVDALLSRYVFPLLQPHQSAWIVPGLFGQNRTRGNHTIMAESDALLIQKLAAYWALYAAHDKVTGIMAWHWNDLGAAFSPASETLGGSSFPRTLALWAEIRNTLNW